MHSLMKDLMMYRYLVKGQSVQTLAVEVDSEQVSLPSVTGTPSRK